MARLSIDRARRIALAAQGFADGRPSGRRDVRHFRRVLNRVNVVQLDSVNVLARAHYLPFFARLGSFDTAALDRWIWQSGELFEYWVHMASVAPVTHRSLVAHRMNGGWHWPAVERMNRENPGLVEGILETVRREGPVRVGDVDGESRTGPWWGWTDSKIALEHLFLTGRLTVADRPNFARVYDLPERVHPAALEVDALPAPDAKRELLALAARSHGVGTVHDLADYYRLKVGESRRLVADLVRRGDLEEVEVEGWKEPAYLHVEATAPRRVEGAALLAPFDPVVWFRDRLERLFGFFYRIEIYTPAPRRVHGYYVLPYLLDGELVGRVDLKADRAAGVLRVRGAFAEDGHDPARLVAGLVPELHEMAGWLGLGDVSVHDNGDLAPALGAAV